MTDETKTSDHYANPNCEKEARQFGIFCSEVVETEEEFEDDWVDGNGNPTAPPENAADWVAEF